jgi:hypothetical protein
MGFLTLIAHHLLIVLILMGACLMLESALQPEKVATIAENDDAAASLEIAMQDLQG